MRKYQHHNDGPVCNGCEDRLADAHEYMAVWFRAMKENNPTMHVSWSFRDEASQNEAFEDGASKLRFPLSKHNKMRAGAPCAEALDVFQIIDGRAVFDPIFCARLNDVSKDTYHLRWGGTFVDSQGKPLHDNDHFEIANEPFH